MAKIAKRKAAKRAAKKTTAKRCRQRTPQAGPQGPRRAQSAGTAQGRLSAKRCKL